MKTHSVKYNFFMNSILTVASMLFPLITFPYISRILLVEGSGKVAFAISVVSYFTMFATLGIPTYGIRACARVRDDKEKLSKTVQELLIISGTTTTITYIVFFVTLIFVPQFAQYKDILLVTGISIGLNTIGVQWFYNALEQYSYITTCAIAFKLIGIILMVTFVREPKDYLIYGGIYVIGSFGSYVLNFIRLKRFVTFRKTGSYNFHKHLKAIAVFFAMSAGASIYLNLDIVMLGLIKGDVDVGYYNAGIKVKSILVTSVTSLGTVLLPRLSYYVEKQDKQAFQKMISKAFNFVFVVASSVTVYFVLYAKESILFLAGKAFLPAVMPMVILMPTVLLIGCSNITGIQVLTPLGQEKKVLYSIVAGAILDFTLNLVLIPHIGAVGAAISTTLAESLVLLVQCVLLKELLGSIVKNLCAWKTVIGLLAATGTGLLVKKVFTLETFPMLAVSAILFFGVYGVILTVLKEPFMMSLWDIAKGIKRKGSSKYERDEK